MDVHHFLVHRAHEGKAQLHWHTNISWTDWLS